MAMSAWDPERRPLKGGKGLDLVPRVARLWWVGVLRGVIALALGSSALLASGSPERLATFLFLYWLAGGVLTLRLAWDPPFCRIPSCIGCRRSRDHRGAVSRATRVPL